MTAELSSRIHTAAVTALAFVCTYVLAFYWNLDRPFWAGFTVFVISLPSIGQTLQKGVLRMFGTICRGCRRPCPARAFLRKSVCSFCPCCPSICA